MWSYVKKALHSGMLVYVSLTLTLDGSSLTCDCVKLWFTKLCRSPKGGHTALYRIRKTCFLLETNMPAGDVAHTHLPFHHTGNSKGVSSRVENNKSNKVYLFFIIIKDTPK